MRYVTSIRRTGTLASDSACEEYRNLFFTLPRDSHGDWINQLISHRWYLRIQRGNFGWAKSHSDRLRIAQMQSEAQALFAIRLWKNPTLGIPEGRQEQLPAYVRNNARSIASQIFRQQRQSTRHSELPDDVFEPSSESRWLGSEDVMRDLDEVLATLLVEEDELVARFRWFVRWPETQVASGLGVTRHEVRVRETRARSAVVAWALEAGFIET